MYPKKIASNIQFEIQQIDKLFEKYNSLFDKCSRSEPDLIELTALASVLYSFYNGIENIFLTIAKKLIKKCLKESSGIEIY